MVSKHHGRQQMKKKKAILKALEPQMPSAIGNLVGGFMAIAIGTIAISVTAESLRESEVLEINKDACGGVKLQL